MSDAAAVAANRSLAATVASNPLWYHTMDLGEGAVTPGRFDLRPVVSRLPWPDVRGRRCLDVGTYDGFLAFELERRGASEVVATDIADHRHWDWPPLARASGPDYLAKVAGPEKGRGFAIARHALRSSVERLELSVYDLDPERVGTFDVVVCGSLLLHLRDPLRALEALRRVCTGWLLSAEEIDLALTMRHPRRPVARLDGGPGLCQWWVPTVAGHRRMMLAGGFRVERSSGLYAIPFGPAHPRTARSLRRRAALKLLAGGSGVPNHALLARPVVGA